MKKDLIISCAVLAAMLMGCESVPVQDNLSVQTGSLTRRFISLSQLRKGLSRAETASVLGKEVVIGYELVDQAAEQYKPVTIPNPQRRETITKGSRAYDVDFYVLGIKTADDRISDDEMVPIVFYQDQLIGVGWEFLDQQIRGR